MTEQGTSPDRHPWFVMNTKRQVSRNFGLLGPGTFDVTMHVRDGQWRLRNWTFEPDEKG